MELGQSVIEEYISFLTNPEAHRIPTSDVDEVQFAATFLKNTAAATKALEKIVSSLADSSDRGRLSEEDRHLGVYAEFAITGHGDTQTNEDGKLTGQSGGTLSEGGIRFAQEQKDQRERKGEGEPYVVLSSDLPRAIHHALLKFASLLPQENAQLAEICAKVNKQEGVGAKDYAALVGLALKHGIVPTQLARAQFYGRLELSPEKFELKVKKGVKDEKITPSDLDAFVSLYDSLTAAGTLGKTKKALVEFIQGFKAADETEKERYRDLYKEALRRSQATAYRMDGAGQPEDENRLFFYHRADALFSVFEKIKDRSRGKKVEIVAHSGFIDVALAYFRNRGKPEEFHITKRPKTASRGETVYVQVNEDFEYLNDPKRLDPIRETARVEAEKLKSRSLDTLVNNGTGILETPLLGFESKEKDTKGEDIYKPYSEKLDDALASSDPIIIFGHGGQGKSILASEIVRRFLEGSFGESYRNYVPIVLNCENLNTPANENQQRDGKAKIESLVRVNSAGLNPVLLKEYRFVYILDDYQKCVNPDYRQELSDTVQKLRKEGNLVIILSRQEGPDVHPPHTPDYKIMKIDTEAVAKQIDDFIEGRIPPEHVDRFKQYLSQYDSSITGYYLTKLFLTMIFPTGNGKNRGVIDFIIDPSIAQAISEGRPLRSTQLYDAQTDFQTGRDIKRLYPNMPVKPKPEEGKPKIPGVTYVVDEIERWKDQLAEKAFQDVFGKTTPNGK